MKGFTPQNYTPRPGSRLRLSRRVIAGVMLVTLVAARPVQAASDWPAAGRDGMVVTAQHLATDVGVSVLRSGGNAVDAAIAVGYALAVVYPAAGNLGGGGFMTIHTAEGRDTFIDFRERAPLKASADMYLVPHGAREPRNSIDGHLAVAVPGTVAGLEYAREHYGTLAREALMAPAIELAQRGFALDRADVAMFTASSDRLAKDPELSSIYLKDGKPPKPGDRLLQVQLAGTLERISARGAEGFYRGETAQSLVTSSQNGGGLITQRDLEDYVPKERVPVSCDYRGYHVVSAPPPSSGGTALCEMLNILEGFPLRAMGFHSAQAVHAEIEAMRRAYVDRNAALGDPDFVANPVQRLTDKGYAASLRQTIDAQRATPTSELVRNLHALHEGSNTTHYSIIDRAGNAVAVTYTLNNWFGAAVTARGTGVVLNDEMDDFTTELGRPNFYGLIQGEPNQIAGGKRPLSSMTPTIVTKNGMPVMVLGTPGGSRIITAVLQTLINVVDHGMTIQEAVDAPRFHHQADPDIVNAEPYSFSAETTDALKAMGYRLREPQPAGHVEAILVGGPAIGTPAVDDERFFGANDPRRGSGSARGCCQAP